VGPTQHKSRRCISGRGIDDFLLSHKCIFELLVAAIQEKLGHQEQECTVMRVIRSALFSLLFLALAIEAAHAKCDPKLDKNCLEFDRPAMKSFRKEAIGKETISKSSHEFSRPVETSAPAEKSAPSVSQPAREPASVNVGAEKPAWTPLQPLRAYLSAKDIPPPDVGAYGLVVFRSRPTPANREKLMKVCLSFVAHFDPSTKGTAAVGDQMWTVWPVDDPNAKEVKKDDCSYAIEHYDLIAAENAISDATLQHADFSGEGPFLVGWSPSKSRKIPDSVILVVDMSSDQTQQEIDHQFEFWKNEIVGDPEKWRGGFLTERIKERLRQYADRYGPALLESIKFFGGKS
jgi:hypothetical protein